MYRLKLAVACFVMGERSGYLGSDLRFQGIALTIGIGGDGECCELWEQHTANGGMWHHACTIIPPQ
ncbi:hypothetical protein [Segatella salivae]|uniref:hypothetical protein n=1 Tax=Segatella salivae TaxID=228604 RepID=UPI001CADB1AC|nr:hypothetical protein [Segatella salivae]MBF1560661.1 hypothetical protein [Segatella salivae]